MAEIIYQSGIAVMTAAAVAAVITAAALHTAGKRLIKQLEQEYGRKRS